jgi:molybdopterin synthase catalytic subunit
MKVKLFATLKDRAKASEVAIDMPQALTVQMLRAVIATQFPQLAPLLPQSVVAVNKEFAFNHDTVQPTDEVALFPPVSGGQ